MSPVVDAIPVVRSLLIDAQETWHHEHEEDVEALGIRARNAIDNLEQLVEATRRTVEASKTFWAPRDGTEVVRARQAIDIAIEAQAAALRRVRGQQ